MEPLYEEYINSMVIRKEEYLPRGHTDFRKCFDHEICAQFPNRDMKVNGGAVANPRHARVSLEKGKRYYSMDSGFVGIAGMQFHDFKLVHAGSLVIYPETLGLPIPQKRIHAIGDRELSTAKQIDSKLLERFVAHPIEFRRDCVWMSLETRYGLIEAMSVQ